MTGNTSPATEVLGATTSGAASTAVLANTGNPIFQIVAVGVLAASIALLLTRAVKAASN